MPSLTTISLTTKNWSCETLKNITSIVNSQMVSFKYNDADEYDVDLTGFVCQMSSSEFNQVQV